MFDDVLGPFPDLARRIVGDHALAPRVLLG
jgi:hypothetical protein